MSGHVAGLWWPHVDREGIRRLPITLRATRPAGVPVAGGDPAKPTRRGLHPWEECVRRTAIAGPVAGERDPVWASLHPRSSPTTRVSRVQPSSRRAVARNQAPVVHAVAGQRDAYAVLDRPGPVGETVQVRRRAAKVLPDCLVPVTVKAVPALPPTVSGKLDADRQPGRRCQIPVPSPPSPAARNLPPSDWFARPGSRRWAAPSPRTTGTPPHGYSSHILPSVLLALTPDRRGAMTTELHEIVEFAPQAQFYMLERSGSFGHREEPDAVSEHLRNLWTCLKS